MFPKNSENLCFFILRFFLEKKKTQFGSQNGPKMEAGGLPEPPKMGSKRGQSEKNIFFKKSIFWEKVGSRKVGQKKRKRGTYTPRVVPKGAIDRSLGSSGGFGGINKHNPV